MKKKISTIMILALMLSMLQIPLLANAQSNLDVPKNNQEETIMENEESNMIQSKEVKEAAKDIVEIALSDGRFKTLTSALKAAGLVDTLKGEGPFTVFAPTDEAFSKLPAGTLDKLLKPENKNDLVKILTYHVTPGKVVAADVMKLNGKEVTMVSGGKAKIEVKNGSVYINGAKVIITDIMAKNGVIHVIDTVIMPSENKM
jgi:uncharacterized surface protein with fasciclin (FAS1) repeats